jgi:hypothetical protein
LSTFSEIVVSTNDGADFGEEHEEDPKTEAYKNREEYPECPEDLPPIPFHQIIHLQADVECLYIQE